MRFREAGFSTEVHRTTVGLRWGLLRRVRYGAVDMWSSDEEGFPLTFSVDYSWMYVCMSVLHIGRTFGGIAS